MQKLSANRFGSEACQHLYCGRNAGDRLGNKCYNNGACSNVTGKCTCFVDGEVDANRCKDKEHSMLRILAVLENASTRHIVSAMLGLLESIAIPGFVQRIAIGMNSNHKVNVFTMKKVQ